MLKTFYVLPESLELATKMKIVMNSLWDHSDIIYGILFPGNFFKIALMKMTNKYNRQ